ncbi:MAG: ABC transporter ATP-binding protein [Actinobacteria bacterium]|nr:ABC transporter ATP-binding protein [Actinomycetota bacterium]MCG2819233.1 ABC transporter ATP-binding protein [Actinomycetes bacterium]MBU4219640.1 ABC transporter ATP-binding protein [Actinomycetota bacterium]MBU4360107.1 ABC transporter ATP-binding protein [Actinomycetota bacterium]MBU4393081.1 ABC transporter ATP-binding protein [Actinomycetota bacterium]
MGEFAVSLNNIRKSYRLGFSRRRVEAIHDISLEVESGKVFGLLGPNGAGKTTALKILLGIVFTDEGTGSVLGKPLGDRSAHHRLGFLPEQPYFYDFLTAEKALDLYGRFFGMGREAFKSRSSALMDMVGLRRDSHLTLGKYSKGMLQRFGIAQALLNDPELVIMDEPSSGLDPLGQKEVRDVLLRLRDEGKTIFLSSHQLSEVESICDSVCIISNGKNVTGGPLSELLEVRGVDRITLEGENPEAPARLEPLSVKVEQAEGVTVLEVESAGVYRALDAARELGMTLLSVEPYRRSLEDLFLESVKEEPV